MAGATAAPFFSFSNSPYFSPLSSRESHVPASSLFVLKNPSFLHARFPRFILHFRRTLPASPCAAVQNVAVEDEDSLHGGDVQGSGDEEGEKRRKLFVSNVPWELSAPDMVKLFSECGAVKDVEIIKLKNGKSRGFSFVTMASSEEAQAVIAKFDSFDLNGRVIRVEFAKKFKGSASPPSTRVPLTEIRYKIYVSNLAWKVRSSNLKSFFSEKLKPLSARVVFETPSGRSAGYGFVGFATKEETESAVSELDGKELMGRPLRLRINEIKGHESSNESEEATDLQPDVTSG